MKPLRFLGDSHAQLQRFSEAARADVGYQLYQVQLGFDPRDWKPMSSVGPGVREIRVRDSDGAHRVIYVTTFAEAVYVLHAFQKKSQRTTRQDLAIAIIRFRDLKRSAAQ
jgi:phage-related protein